MEVASQKRKRKGRSKSERPFGLQNLFFEVGQVFCLHFLWKVTKNEGRTASQFSDYFLNH